MKKRILLITMIGISFGIKSQNNFPPTGNVSIGNSYNGSVLNVLQKPNEGEAHIFLGNPYSETQSGIVSSRLCFAGTGIQHAGLAWVPDSGNYKRNGKLHLTFGAHQNPMKNAIKMTFQSNGNVGIGTINPNGWRLAVNGKIRAKEIKVETEWADFVFYSDYKLPTLAEVEKHIKEKGHLKDIPSAVEVEKNGIHLGEMNSKLLQKIEELTLYTIQQQKEINTQKEKIENVEKENKFLKKINLKLHQLQKRLDKLEKK